MLEHESHVRRAGTHGRTHPGAHPPGRTRTGWVIPTPYYLILPYRARAARTYAGQRVRRRARTHVRECAQARVGAR